MNSKISELINSLDEKKSIVFSGLICKRMRILFVSFSVREDFGNIGDYDKALDIIFTSAMSDRINLKLIESIKLRFEESFPDLDEFDTVYASYALDACSSIEQALMYLLDKKKEHIVNCSTAATDVVDMFVQEYLDLNPSNPDLEDIISNNFFMTQEVNNQLDVLNTLDSVTTLDKDIVDNLIAISTKKPIIDFDRIKE